MSNKPLPHGQYDSVYGQELIDASHTGEAEPVKLLAATMVEVVGTGWAEPLTPRRYLDAGTVLYATPSAATPAAPGEKVTDGTRWRFAMDWGTKDFAVCYRDGNAWVPIKTNGPIDAALSNPAPVAAPAHPADAANVRADWHKLEALGWQRVVCDLCEGDYMRAYAAPAPASEAVAVVEPVSDDGTTGEAMLLKPLPVGTLLYATPTPGDSADAPVQRAGGVSDLQLKAARDWGFNAGTVAALAILAAHDSEVQWHEVLHAAGEDQVLHHAAHVEPEDWKWAGFAKYKLRKPTKRAALKDEQPAK